MSNQIGDWARKPDFNEIGYTGALGQRPRYAIVQLPNGMWTTDQWCIMTGNVFKPSGSRWLLVQFGWSYHTRFRWSTRAAGGPFWREITHVSIPDIAAEPNNGKKPALVGQYGHPPSEEVLNTAINPITGQPEKNFTRLAEGQQCWIPQDKVLATRTPKTFYSITDNGGTDVGPARATVTASQNWVAVINASGLPEFVQI